MALTTNKQTIKKATSPKKKAADVIDELIMDLKEKRETVKTLNQEIKQEQDDLLDAMDKIGIDSRTIRTPDGKTFQATRIQATSIIIDEPKLKKRLGLALWNRVSTRTLDKKKLEAYIASGEVKASIVAECSIDKTSAPFVKVT